VSVVVVLFFVVPSFLLGADHKKQIAKFSEQFEDIYQKKRVNY
jgi:Flp pilus assembly protein TadB